MTLQDILMRAKISDRVKVGAVDGSAFFFAGTPAQFVDGWEEFYRKKKKEADEELTVAKKMAKNDKSRLELEKAIEKQAVTAIEYPDREVVNVFIADRIDEPIRCVVVIIKGYETGRYWTVKEAEGSNGFNIKKVNEEDEAW